MVYNNKKQRHEYYEKNKEQIKQKTKRYYHIVRKKLFQENVEKYRVINKVKNDKRLEKRRKLLLELKEKAGGRCKKCGYNEEIRILHFHHLRDKISEVSLLQSELKIRVEAKKCVLLCPNCHALTHLPK